MTLSTNWDEPHCPSWPGGVAVSKKGILRSNHCRHRRGGCSNSNKTFEQPPRPLLVDASRLLLMSRPPLLSRRGNGAHPHSLTPSMTAPTEENQILSTSGSFHTFSNSGFWGP